MFKAAAIAVCCALAALPLFAEKPDVSTKDAALKSGFVLHCAEANDNVKSETLSAIKLKKIPTGAKEFEVLQPAPKNNLTVNAADFGLTEDIENAATAINRAIAHCKKIGAAKLVIPKGVYKCFDAVSITLEGFEDFTADFSGSTLVYYSPSISPASSPAPQWSEAAKSIADVKITNCERLKICNLKLDWDWARDPLGAFVKVVGKDANAGRPYIDLEFFQYKKYPKFGKRAPVVTLVPFRDDLSHIRDGRCGWFKTPENGMGEGVDALDNEWISPNVLRIFPKLDNFFKEAAPGSTYRLLHYYYGKSGIKMEANRHLTLENIDILSCRGHALHVDAGQQFWQYINVNVAPPADDPRRAITCTADHHHVANSRGCMKILNSTFSMGSDDGANIHDRSFFMKRAGERVLTSANSRGLEYFSPQVGDELSLMQDDFRPTGYTGKILKIDGERVELDKPLPKQDGEGFVCFNQKYGTRNIIIRDCKYTRHGCRGILLPAKDVTVENCLFEREQMGAIKCESGYTKSIWCEGYGVDNIVVRGCVFKMCNIRGIKSQGFARDIMLAAYMKTDPSDEQPASPIIKNVLFENNKFYDLHGLVATVSGSENVIFRNNEIHAGGECGGDLWYKGGFAVIGGKNIFIVDNAFFGDVPFAGVIEKKGAVENLNASGNRKISE